MLDPAMDVRLALRIAESTRRVLLSRRGDEMS
jgi:hypothetical protein